MGFLIFAYKVAFKAPSSTGEVGGYILKAISLYREMVEQMGKMFILINKMLRNKK